jgi:hypothetical protein
MKTKIKVNGKLAGKGANVRGPKRHGGRKPGATTLTRQERKAILADHNNGMDSPRIATKHRRSMSTIWKILRGYPRKRNAAARVVSPLEQAINAMSRALGGKYTRVDVDLEAMTYIATPAVPDIEAGPIGAAK